MARAAPSGSLRPRKGSAPPSRCADGSVDDGALLLPEGEQCDSDCRGGWPRKAMIVLCCLQAMLLVGFAHVARQKRAQREPEPPSRAVPVLTDETLPFFVAGLPNGTLVNFHSPDCVYCRALEPEFEAAARALQARGGAPLVSVSAASAPRAVARYGVRRFPTMLWFRKGQQVLELPPSARTAAKIIEYVEWASQPALVTFEARADLDEAVPHLRQALRAAAPPVVVGFGTEDRVLPALEAAAERSRGKTVFIFVADVREGDPPLRAYRQEAERDQEFEGDVNPEAVRAWVETLLSPKNATR